MFVCTKGYERLTRFEKGKKNVEGIKGRSAVFISPLKTIKYLVNGKLHDKEPINLWFLWKMPHMSPNKLQQQKEFQLQNL